MIFRFNLTYTSMENAAINLAVFSYSITGNLWKFARAIFQNFSDLPPPQNFFFKKLLTTAVNYDIIYIETEVIAMKVIAMKKLLGFIATVLIIWFIVSIVDINMHNMTTQSYWKYNMFTMFMEVIGK